VACVGTSQVSGPSVRIKGAIAGKTNIEVKAEVTGDGARSKPYDYRYHIIIMCAPLSLLLSVFRFAAAAAAATAAVLK